MSDPSNKLSFNEKAEKILAENNETQQEIARLLKLVEDIKNKREIALRKLGITPEMEKEAENFSVSDLSVAEQKLFNIIQQEYREELANRGLDANLIKTEKTRSKTNQTLSRKRLRI